MKGWTRGVGCSKRPWPSKARAIEAGEALGVDPQLVHPYWCWRHDAWHWTRKPLNAPYQAHQEDKP